MMNIKSAARFAAALSLVGLSVSLAMPTRAATAVDAATPSRVVRFGDLDLSTVAGTRVLHRRIGTAALQVCQVMMPARTVIELGKCRRELMDTAVAEVSRATLTSLHGGKVIEVTARR